MAGNKYLVGEIRQFGYEVGSSLKNDILVITSATWELTDKNGVIETRTGDCDVDGTDIYALIELEAEGTYILRITVDAPPQRLKKDFTIKVER